MSSSLPFGQVPTLKVDDQVLTQSNGINRYVGKLADLYPEDPWPAALCDEVMDAVEDVGHRVVATFSIHDEAAKKAKREEITEGPLSTSLVTLGRMLESRGGGYFCDDRLTVADLRVYVWMRALRSGSLDYIPADLADRVAPAVSAHFQRVDQHPGVRAYYQKVGATP